MTTGLPLIIHDNRFADAVPVASDTAGGDYDVNNLIDFRPYTWWKPNTLPATVTVDSGSVQQADCCVVYGHDLASHGATLEVRMSTDAFVANDVLITSITPTSNKPFILMFTQQSSQHWRIRITGTTNPALAIVALGNKFEFPRRLKLGFDPLGRKVHGATNRSDKGHSLGQVLQYEEWSETLAFKHMTWTWLRSEWLPLWDAHLKTMPWVFAWDPTNHADELYLVTSHKGFKAPITGGEFTSLSIDVSGVVPA